MFRNHTNIIQKMSKTRKQPISKTAPAVIHLTAKTANLVLELNRLHEIDRGGFVSFPQSLEKILPDAIEQERAKITIPN